MNIIIIFLQQRQLKKMGRGGKSLDKVIYQMSHDDEKLIKVDLAGKGISDHGAIRLSSGK